MVLTIGVTEYNNLAGFTHPFNRIDMEKLSTVFFEEKSGNL